MWKADIRLRDLGAKKIPAPQKGKKGAGKLNIL
ncbi:MAG: hypothetical protein ACI8YQ_002867 [Polaribacter sp.]|jgi:hypothetical protein